MFPFFFQLMFLLYMILFCCIIGMYYFYLSILSLFDNLKKSQKKILFSAVKISVDSGNLNFVMLRSCLYRGRRERLLSVGIKTYCLSVGVRGVCETIT